MSHPTFVASSAQSHKPTHDEYPSTSIAGYLSCQNRTCGSPPTIMALPAQSHKLTIDMWLFGSYQNSPRESPSTIIASPAQSHKPAIDEWPFHNCDKAIWLVKPVGLFLRSTIGFHGCHLIVIRLVKRNC